MTLSDDEFHGLCRALDCGHIAEDPRFATLEARQRNRPALIDAVRGEIADAAKRLSLAEAAERYAAQDVPFARARRLTELHEDPQIVHNEVFETIDHPVAGRLRQARPAPRFGRTPVAPAAPAPVSGQHTREILAEIGYADRVEEWIAQGVVAVASGQSEESR